MSLTSPSQPAATPLPHALLARGPLPARPEPLPPLLATEEPLHAEHAAHWQAFAGE